MSVAELKAALKALGWSQQAFASRLGVSGNTVTKWATGRARVPGPVAAYLGLAVRVKDLAGAL